MFRRQLQLLGSKQKLLENKKVLIIGAGGLGNSLATFISCIGLKKIIIIDFDKIEIHNIHRQIQFNKKDIGKSKVNVLGEKIKRCDTEVEIIEGKFNSSMDFDVDLIFDATDNFETRKEIDKFAKKNKLPWIYASVDEYYGQVGFFKNTDFSIFATKNLSSKGQIAPMVSLIASIEAMLGIKYLIGELNEEVLYYIDFKDDLKIKKFKI
jgi:molybdopterin/thiamine biosynthesis adenylyltransferase